MKATRWFIAGLGLLALGLGACGVRGAQMQESSLLRTFERKRGLIAYEGPDGNVYTIDQASGNRSQITRDAWRNEDGSSMTYAAPTWSFDGRHLAYAMYRSNAAGEHQEGALYVAAPDGSGPRELTRGDGTRRPFYIYFSPDSRYVSLLSERFDERTLELGIMPVREQGGYRKLDNGAPFTWIWRLDGKAVLAFVGGERMTMIDVDSSARRNLPVTPGVFQAPDLSPDGRRLLYVTGDEPGALRLVLRDLDTNTEEILATAEGLLYFAFSPDGKHVAYLDSTSGTTLPVGRLTILRPGTRTKPVTVKEENVLGFYWAPDSRKVAFFIPSPPQSAEDVDPVFALAEGIPYIAIMIADTGGRSWLGARFPTTEGFLNNLPFFDQLQRSDTMWSPDSRYFVFAAYTPDEVAGLFIAAADGNLKARFIDYGENASWSRR